MWELQSSGCPGRAGRARQGRPRPRVAHVGIELVHLGMWAVGMAWAKGGAGCCAGDINRGLRTGGAWEACLGFGAGRQPYGGKHPQCSEGGAGCRQNLPDTGTGKQDQERGCSAERSVPGPGVSFAAAQLHFPFLHAFCPSIVSCGAPHTAVAPPHASTGYSELHRLPG